MNSNQGIDFGLDFSIGKTTSIIEFQFDENGEVVKIEKDPLTLSIERNIELLLKELEKHEAKIEWLKLRVKYYPVFIPIIVKNNSRRIRIKIDIECE